MKIITNEKKYIMNTYNRLPVHFESGKGVYLYDNKGKKYLDFLSGIAVNSFGHSNQKINNAIKKQVDKLIHVSNWFYMEPQVKLAEQLVKLYKQSGKVFFSNSGAEANECAIKLARKWGKKYDKNEIVTFQDSFHGRTIATLTATGQSFRHKGFDPLPKGFKYAVFNDINSLKKIVTKKTCAVLLEVIQGEGGVCIAEPKFIKELVNLSKKYKFLIICDEVQIGLGRTGKMFGYKHYSLKPDIVTLAKSLAAGLPLGATIASDEVAKVFDYGSHGSTFGGNLVSCTAAIESIKLITPKILNNIRSLEKYFFKKLQNLKEKHSIIERVRGKGLIIAMDIKKPGRPIVERCLEKGVVINVTQNKVIRFLPPYIINKSHIDKVVSVLDEVLSIEQGSVKNEKN